jgi:transcriptional regulator with XRE-family HTH domain
MSPQQLPRLLRKEIKRRGLSQYRIAEDTGIKQPSLSRFLNGGSLKMETAAVLLDYLGYEVRPKRRHQ